MARSRSTPGRSGSRSRPASLLILFADQPRARTAAAIYAGTLLLAFGTSSAYHRLAKSYRARKIMQRADHSMIYLLIAGTYVPICLVALPLGWGITVIVDRRRDGAARDRAQDARLQAPAVGELRALPRSWAGQRSWRTPVLIDHLTAAAAGADRSPAESRTRSACRSCCYAGPTRGRRCSATTRSGTGSPCSPPPSTSAPWRWSISAANC